MVMDRIGATLRVVICPGANKDFSRGDMEKPDWRMQILSMARAAIAVWPNLKQVRLASPGLVGDVKRGDERRKRARR